MGRRLQPVASPLLLAGSPSHDNQAVNASDGTGKTMGSNMNERNAVNTKQC